MATQGLQLPIQVQISNLQEIAQQLKQFASSNVLADSLGGKKIDAELAKVLRTLGQIELKSKSAFKTDADFSGLEKDVTKVELSLEKVQTTIANLQFKDLKIPQESVAQIEALNAKIQELKAGFASFKAGQRDKLLANASFTTSMQNAFGTGEASKILAKNYDDIYNAVKDGMDRVNRELQLQKNRFEENSRIVTQNTEGKANFTAWGALEWLQKAFEQLPKDHAKMNEQQKVMADFMKINPETNAFDGWQRGAVGLNGFYKHLIDSLHLDPSQVAEIRRRIQDAMKEFNRTAQEELQKIATDPAEGARIFGNTKGMSFDSFLASRNKYDQQVKARDTAQLNQGKAEADVEAMRAAWESLKPVQDEVAAQQAVLAQALKEPESALQSLQSAIRQSITNAPELGAAYGQATQRLNELRQAASAGKAQLANLDQTLNKLQGLSNFITRYVGIYAIIRRVSTAIRNAFNNIKELDKTITNIAVVTNMSQADLWGKIGQYTEMAQQYGVATKDVYTVSQIFYQQGLQTAQVMDLTTETLKMAKISGMDYGSAANAMTVAIRAFKIEMTEAQQVTDTYSALAAKFAVSSQEIANAMEKTASSAANVGMSLQSTSAFISVMEQTTREGAQNIGSALKSIISRYGEMKASPETLLNIDGEDVSFNKVDTALKSVGISIKDASGQFRNFDDVIMELSKKWDTLDNNTQRYIATVMAGNRQQSRFIALVSNYDELSRAMDVANNAENASIAQTAKTMDSLESKANQLKNAFSQIYLDLHVESGLKDMYDWLTRILKTIGKLGMLKGAIPTLANIIGFGTGTKSLINTAKNSITERQKKVQIDTSEAESKAKQLEEILSRPVTKKVIVDDGTGGLTPTAIATNTAALVNDSNVSAAMSPALLGFLTRSNPGMTEEQARTELYGALATGQLTTAAASQTAFLNKMNVPEENWEGDNGALNALAGLASAAQNATTGLNTVGTSGTSASTGLEEAGRSGTNASTGLQNLGTSAETASTAEQTKVSSAVEAAQADLNKAVEAREAARADLQQAEAALEAANNSSTLSASEKELAADHAATAKITFEKAQADAAAARAALTKAQADEEGAQSERDETNANHESAASEREEANTNRNKNGGGANGGGANGGKYNSTLMKGIGVASGVARLAGTAITALGAAHEDKSTDKVETSKLLTGLGNGVSMAGTGASMGMAFGPWGALVGAVGGFLIGGLGAILDGLDYTMQERYEKSKEEAKKATDVSLQQKAKVTDLSSQIENIEQLRKAMYNSSDDMQAYKDAMNNMAEQYPNLISAYDEAGNAIINLTEAEALLLDTRAKSAKAAREAAIKNLDTQDKLTDLFTETRKSMSAVVKLGMRGLANDNIPEGGASYSDLHILMPVKDANGKYSYIDTGSGRYMTPQKAGQGTNALPMPEWFLDVETAVESLRAHRSEFDPEDEALIGSIVDRHGLNHPNVWTQEELETFMPWFFEHSEGNLFSYKGASAGLGNDMGGKERGLAAWEKIQAEGYIRPSTEEQGRVFIDAGYMVKLKELMENNSELFGGVTDPKTFFHWDDSGYISMAQYQEMMEWMRNQEKMMKRSRTGYKKIVDQSYAEEYWLNALNGEDRFSTTTKKSLSNNAIYQNIIYQMMESLRPEQYETFEDWEKGEPVGFSNLMNYKVQGLLDWLSGKTQTYIDGFTKAVSDMSVFKTGEEMLESLDIDPASELGQALMQQFADSTQANRDRILKMVYQYDDEGEQTQELNRDLKGLKKLSTFDEEGEHNGAFAIAQRFADSEEKPAEIISKYADYFATQLAEINTLAEQGYVELAGSRLDVLNKLSESLATIKDSKVQDDLFSIITTIDFSSYESISQARKQIAEYGQKNNKMDVVQPFLDQLDYAAETLVFNVNTLASELATKVETAAKEIDTLLSSVKQGLTLDKALESFGKLTAAYSDIKSFDEIFTYDAVLGKYVYTANGLSKAIAQKEDELKEQAERLQTAVELDQGLLDTVTASVDSEGKRTYKVSSGWESRVAAHKEKKAGAYAALEERKANWKTQNDSIIAMLEANGEYDPDQEYTYEELTELWESAGLDITAYKKYYDSAFKKKDKLKLSDQPLATWEVTGYRYSDASEIVSDVSDLYGRELTQEEKERYERLTKDFMENEKYTVKTWDEFMKYLDEQVAAGDEAAKLARSQYDAYQANTKNQFYQAIDWSKLMAGTDLTGTNQVMMEALAKQLNMMNEAGEWLVDKSQQNWKSVLDEYLKTLYGHEILDDEGKGTGKYEVTTSEELAAYNEARSSILGQLVTSAAQQATTAINELLGGTGTQLSETTRALLKNAGLGSMIDGEGLLTAGDNLVDSTADLYRSIQKSFKTITDANTAYSSILTKKYEQANQAISTLASGASLDISSLATTFTTFGLKLSDYYNNEFGQWAWTVEGFETDQFGKTRITDWDAFTELIKQQSQYDIGALSKTYEYKNAYASYVDGIISLDTRWQELYKKNYDNAFSAITEWKPLNVSWLKDNEELWNKFVESGAIDKSAIKDGKLIVKDAVAYARTMSDYMMVLSTLDSEELYRTTGWTSADLAKNWKNAQTVLTQVKDTWTSLAENITSINADNIAALLEKGNFDFNDLVAKDENGKAFFTKVGDAYILRLDKYREYLVKAIAGDKTESELTDAEKEQINNAYLKAQSAIVSKITGLDWTKMLDGTATTSDVNTFIQDLRNALISLGISISDFYTEGTLNLSEIKNKLQAAANTGEIDEEVAEQIINNINTTIAAVRDSALEEISSGFKLMTEGTTNQAEIQKFVQRYNKILQEGQAEGTVDSLFDYDEYLQTYTLTTAALKTYNDNQKAILRRMGMSEAAINQYIADQTQSLIAAEMDISGFLSANDNSATNVNTQKLIKAIQQWYELQDTEIQNGIIEKIKATYGEDIDMTNIDNYVSDYFIKRIKAGGEDAVAALKELKGANNVSSDEIQAAYKAEVNRLQAAADQVANIAVNQIVTGDLLNIISGLKDKGFKVTDLGDGTGVITAVGDMVDVYAEIYKQMAATAEATTAGLNSAFAKVLTAKDQGNIDAVSALGDAMGMDYDALGQLIAQYGKGAWSDLEFMMAHQFSAGIEALGNGQVRIIDWKKFSGTMNWEIGGEAYIEAYNAYNDSLIELDRKAGKQIVEEIKNVSEAKTGDRINITYLTEAIEGGENAINAALLGMGAEVKDGILTIKNGARIGDIIATLANMAKKSGQAITSELAELADAVEEFLDNIVNLIKNGIGGSLKNSEANTLKEWAKTYAGIEDLDFTRTAEGLQLSEQSAIALYVALKKVDSVKASLVFDELSESLQKNNDNFKSVSALMGHIRKISEGVYAADGKTSKARLQQYEAELAVAKEILAIRSTQEDDSFNFMSNKIPAAQNNPLNYAKNWTQALQTIRDAFSTGPKKAGKRGFIDYQDWYNIATEINNMAATTGQEIKIGALTFKGDLESASAAIQAGAESLTTVDTGELKVNLASVGIGIKSGADAMTDGITEGIQGVAKAQVAALDGLIAMLELIVAMEQLGDIDTEGNGIDLTDLFEVTYDENGNPNGHNMDKFSADYERWVAGIKDKINKDSKNYNEDLANAVNGITIDGTALTQILDWNPKDFKDPANANVAKAYAAVLDAFNKAALSGNYDLDNIQQSVLQVLAESGFEDTVTLDIGDMTYVISAGTMTTIDWTDTDTNKILDDLATTFSNDKKKARNELTKWIQQYGKGEIEGKTELYYVLATKKVITMEDGEVTSVTIGDYTYTPSNCTDMEAAVNAAVLADWGYTVTKEDIEAADPNSHAVKIKTKIGDKEIDVESDEGKVLLVGPHGKYKNQSEFLQKEWEWVEKNNFTTEEGKVYESKEKWQWGEYHVATQITPKFTLEVEGEDAKETDPTTNSELRGKLTDLITGGRESIQALITDECDNGDGTYTVDLGGGYKFTFTGGTDPTTALENQIGELLGIDVGLSNTISTAIANAFANEDVSKSISDAMSKGIQDALGTSEGGEGAEVPIPTLTIKPEALTINADGVTPQFGSGETVTNEIVVPEITIKPTKVTVSAENLNGALPEGTTITVETLNALVAALTLVQAWTTPDESGLTKPTTLSEGIDALTATVKALALSQGWELPDESGLTKPTTLSEQIASLEAMVAELKLKDAASRSTDDKGVSKPTALTSTIDTLDAIVTQLKLACDGKTAPDESGITLPTELAKQIASLTAQVAQIAFSPTEAAAKDAATGPSQADLGIQSVYTSEDSIDFIQNVKLTYNVETDEDAASIMNTRSALYGQVQSNRYGEHWFNPSTLDYTHALEPYGLNHTYGQGWSITEGSDLANYVESLRSMVSAGQQLGEVDLSNLEALKDLNFDSTTAKNLTDLYNAATVNAVDAETNMATVKELIEGGIDVSSLENVAGALERIAAAVASLAGAPWSSIAEGINSISGGLSNEPKTPGSTGDGDVNTAMNNVADSTNTAATATTNLTSDMTTLGTEAEIASGHVSKMGELAGGAEHEVQNLGTAATAAAEALSNLNKPDSEKKGEVQDTGAIDDAAESLNNAAGAAQSASAAADAEASSQEGLSGAISTAGESAGSAAPQIQTLSSSEVSAGGSASSAAGLIYGLAGAIRSIPGHTSHNIQLNLSAKVTSTEGKGTVSLTSLTPRSINALSFAKGNARAGGQSTLMGELGPELVVSNGQYFIVGQGGAEFVDLAPDAIVFNHKQTAQLLSNGKAGRGKPITNEDKAISWAKGNANGGPAMASASAALAALKQLRAQWKALEALSAKDLAGKAGGGGGGGGKNAAFIKELERWYNLLQEIATLEQKITYEQTKRAKIQSSFNKSGKEYFQSQKDSLKYLEAEVQRHQQLADEQQVYFDKRRAELNKQSAFSELYTFDENGQIKYKEGKFEELSKRFGGDSTTGKPNYSVKEQYDWLISQGYGYAMEYNENGEKIEIKDDKDEAGMKSAIEAFWAKIDSDQSEMQELHDSIEEHKKAVLEKQQAQNEILKEIEDNQLSVENKVLKSLEDAKKRQIDELQKQKDAIEKGNENLIKGLTEQLDIERRMYQSQESQAELESKRRKLAILQRSGGSAAEINSLQKEIDNDAREEYFNKQQEQIDTIQQASDNELEKLQQQIDLMTETLEYQKENGLLWAQVYEVMARSPEEIADYIKANDSSYWGKSPADLARSMRDDLFEAEKWAAFAAEGVDIKDYVAKIAEQVTAEDKAKKKQQESSGGDSSGGSDGSSGSGGGGNTDTKPAQTPKTPGKNKTYTVSVNGTSKTFTDLKAAQQYYNSAVGGYASSFVQGNQMLVGAGKKYKDAAALNAAATAYAKGIVKKSGFKEGGMITGTGLAMVHGSKAKPEAVLNAEQTRILRDNILSTKPDSLISLLKSYNEAYHGLSTATYDSISDNSNSVVIEHAEVNMHVAKMDNSYDAAKAGDDVMREILSIAAKTPVRNRIS